MYIFFLRFFLTSSASEYSLDVQAGPCAGHVVLSTIEIDARSYFHMPDALHFFASIYDLVLFYHYNSFQYPDMTDSNLPITLSVMMSDHAKTLNAEVRFLV